MEEANTFPFRVGKVGAKATMLVELNPSTHPKPCAGKLHPRGSRNAREWPSVSHCAVPLAHGDVAASLLWLH
jgi:hypothetical protein